MTRFRRRRFPAYVPAAKVREYVETCLALGHDLTAPCGIEPRRILRALQQIRAAKVGA